MVKKNKHWDGPEFLDRSSPKCYLLRKRTPAMIAEGERYAKRLEEQRRIELEKIRALSVNKPKPIMPDEVRQHLRERKERQPKRPSREGLVDIATIAKQLNMIPREARAALRGQKIAKPPQGWAFTSSEVDSIKKVITSWKKPSKNSSRNSSTPSSSSKNTTKSSRITSPPSSMKSSASVKRSEKNVKANSSSRSETRTATRTMKAKNVSRPTRTSPSRSRHSKKRSK